MKSPALLVPVALLASCSTFMRKAPERDPGTRPVHCSASSAYSSIDGVGAGVFAIAGAMFLGKGLGAGTDPEESHVLVPLGIAAAAAAITYGWSALSANAAAERCRAFNAPTPGPTIDDRSRRRTEAWALTRQAAEAARAGDCATARSIDPQVRALDADFHATVFARDAAIARCLAP